MPTRKPGTRLRTLICMVAGLLGMAALAIGLTIWWLRVDTVDNASRNAGNLATVLAEQTDRSIQSIDLMLNEIRGRIEDQGATTPEAFRRLMSDKDTYDVLTERMGHLSQVTLMALADDRGDVVISTSRWPVPRVNISDRQYFHHAKNNNDSSIYVSNPVVARIQGVKTIFFSRRLNGTEGKFLGVIIIGVKLGYFDHIYRSIKSLSHISFLFLHRDGSVILRYPGGTNGITKMPAYSPWYQLIANGGGHYRSPGYFDRRARLVAVHPLRDYPLVIDVAAQSTSPRFI
jgi:hypothetical protein